MHPLNTPCESLNEDQLLFSFYFSSFSPTMNYLDIISYEYLFAGVRSATDMQLEEQEAGLSASAAASFSFVRLARRTSGGGPRAAAAAAAGRPSWRVHGAADASERDGRERGHQRAHSCGECAASCTGAGLAPCSQHLAESLSSAIAGTPACSHVLVLRLFRSIYCPLYSTLYKLYSVVLCLVCNFTALEFVSPPQSTSIALF